MLPISLLQFERRQRLCFSRPTWAWGFPLAYFQQLYLSTRVLRLVSYGQLIECLSARDLLECLDGDSFASFWQIKLHLIRCSNEAFSAPSSAIHRIYSSLTSRCPESMNASAFYPERLQWCWWSFSVPNSARTVLNCQVAALSDLNSQDFHLTTITWLDC